ncbi:hypothetical protein [Saccharibacillus deserti]|uniref:hypothetical protein n=1 Tax=Saccharibacillus deserti TaxID=1634444 RepID=UPI0015545759|nr:hypothetical protein [Saccharibacillus deserti]
MTQKLGFRQITRAAAASLALFLPVACASEPQSRTEQISVTQNPTAAEWLKLEEQASVFQYEDVIYTAGVSWVDELELKRSERLTEVLRQNSDGDSFQNGDANRLKAGTPIYRVKDRRDVLIAETPEGDIRLYQLVEG